MRTKTLKAPVSLVTDGPPGTVRAVFSVFNMKDSDGDVVLPSFFTDGQPLLMAAWGHNWGDLSVGKGVVRVTDQHATFDGTFNLETIGGQEHYKTVKFNGDLQEWSFGFRVLEQKREDFNGEIANLLSKGEIYEASPVLIGANRSTYTEGLKSVKGHASKAGREVRKLPEGLDPFADRMKYLGYMDEYCSADDMAPEGSYEALAESISDAFETAQIPAGTYGYVRAVATFPSHAILYMWRSGDDDASFWDVPYAINPDGTVSLGTATAVEPQMAFVPAKGLDFGVEAARIGLALGAIVERAKAGSAIRRKEGRAISTARRAQIEGISGSLTDHAATLTAMLEETAPAPKGSSVEARRAYLRSLQQTFEDLMTTEIGA